MTDRPTLLVTLEGAEYTLDPGEEATLGSGALCRLPVPLGPTQWARVRHGTGWILTPLELGTEVTVGANPPCRFDSVERRMLIRLDQAPETTLTLQLSAYRITLHVRLITARPLATSPLHPTEAVGRTDHQFLGAGTPRGHAQEFTMRLALGQTVIAGTAPGPHGVTLRDPTVEPRNTTFCALQDGRWLVRDLHQGTKTFLDGRPVLRAMVKPPATIAIGHFLFQLLNGELLRWRVIQEPAGLTVTGLTAAYRKHRAWTKSRPPQAPLRSVTFELSQGGLLAVVGPSGAGKSTLCMAILGEVAHRTGLVTLGGEPLRSIPNPALVSFVPQTEANFGELQVGAILRYSARLRLGRPTASCSHDAQIGDVLLLLKLDRAQTTRYRDLSGGMKRRVSVALELLTRPSLLLLDEPTSGLDEGLDRSLMHELRSLAKDRHTTIVVITHATANLSLADRVLALRNTDAAQGAAASSVGFFGSPELLLNAFRASAAADVMDRLREGETAMTTDLPDSSSQVQPRHKRNRHSRPSLRGWFGSRSSLAVNLQRECHRLVRRPKWVLPLTTLLPTVCAAIAILISPQGLLLSQSLLTSITILVITDSFLAMALTSTAVVADYAVIEREHRWGTTPFIVILSRALSRIPAASLQAASMTLVAAALGPMPTSAPPTILPPWSTLFLLLFSLAIASSALGLLTSAVSRSVEQAVGLMSASLAALVILCGAVVHFGNATGFARGLALVAYAAPTRWATAGLAAMANANQLGGTSSDPMWLSDTSHTLVPLAALLALAIFYILVAVAVLQHRLPSRSH